MPTTEPSISVDDFLAHHGVKGMKWGRRKAVPRSETNSSRKKILTTVAVVAGSAAAVAGAAFVAKKLGPKIKLASLRNEVNQMYKKDANRNLDRLYDYSKRSGTEESKMLYESFKDAVTRNGSKRNSTIFTDLARTASNL